MIQKHTLLEQIRADILSQGICPDLAKQAKNLVMGDGNEDAQIVIIGEAPGKNEDEQGKPFIGASGKFLTEMLLQSGLRREDVYITNIVKYRPPKNRDPSESEKKAFWPFLLRQLEVINPTIVVTLGRHSMEYFIPEAKISDVHGDMRVVKVGDNQFNIVPLYHPAAAIYNRKLRQTLIDDFKELPKIIKKLEK